MVSSSGSRARDEWQGQRIGVLETSGKGLGRGVGVVECSWQTWCINSEVRAAAVVSVQEEGRLHVPREVGIVHGDVLDR